MGGGLMQLVAYGAQDIYLTGNPQITFFKVVYRRYTNFAMEAIEQTDEDKDYTDLVADLNKINSHFSSFDSESDEEFTLTEENIKALSEDVIALRSKIIGE